MSDTRSPGVAVYPHVRTDITADMERVAKELARIDAPATAIDAIDEAVQIILALPPAELATFAQRLAVANSPHADTVADAILDAVYDVAFPAFPLGMVIGGPAQRLDANTPWCGQCALPTDICRGHDVPAPTDPADAVAAALLALDDTQMAALAQRLAGADAATLDRLADMLLGNIGLDLPPVMPSERFMQRVLARVADDEYRHQVAWAQ